MNGLEAMTVQEWLVTTLSTDADLATLAGGAPSSSTGSGKGSTGAPTRRRRGGSRLPSWNLWT